MPKRGVSNEALYERLIFAFDGDDYRVVACDTDGNLTAAVLADQSIEVVQDDAADLKATVDIAADQNVQARGYGYIGAAWQKVPLPFGLSGRVAEIVTDTNTGAGTDSVSTTAVPAGEYHIVSQISMYVASGSANNLVAYLNAAGTTPGLFGYTSPTSSQVYDRQGWWVLAPGDYIQVYGFDLTAGDDLSVSVAGFRVDIDQ